MILPVGTFGDIICRQQTYYCSFVGIISKRNFNVFVGYWSFCSIQNYKVFFCFKNPEPKSIWPGVGCGTFERRKHSLRRHKRIGPWSSSFFNSAKISFLLREKLERMKSINHEPECILKVKSTYITAQRMKQAWFDLICGRFIINDIVHIRQVKNFSIFYLSKEVLIKNHFFKLSSLGPFPQCTNCW